LGDHLTDNYLTPAEVAGLLKVSPKTIQRLLKKGEIPAFRVGTQWRFDREQIEAWAQEQMVSVQSYTNKVGLQ
jgi:excisionase family DNA binding protein